jgi:CSLREA domain-containing protein
MRRTSAFIGYILGVLIMLIAFSATSEVRAAQIVVNSTADNGTGGCTPSECTLREAVVQADNQAGDDTIEFDLTGFAGTKTIILTQGGLSIFNNGALTINGTGASQLSISGNNAWRVFYVDQGANLTLNGVTVTAGKGGGLFGYNFGGGILNSGTLNLINSIVSGNSSSGDYTGSIGTNFGGGIYNDGSLIITNSIISGNLVSGSSNINRGGGIFNGKTLTVINSTISGNFASGSNGSDNYGGGIFNSGGIITLTNSTVSGNSSSGAGSSNFGGGISNESGGTLNLTNSTITNNSAIRGISNYGGGIYNLGTGNARNTIISGNTAPANPDLYGLMSATSQNNLVGGNAMLGTLANNGGPTETHALLSNSPAINAGNNCVKTQSCANFNAPVAVAADQRVVARDATVDIGSYEFNNIPTAASVSISGRVLAGTGRGLANALVYLTDSAGNSQTRRTNSFGYYRFEDVAAGQSVIISVASKRYQFAPQAITVTEEINELNFVGEP